MKRKTKKTRTKKRGVNISKNVWLVGVLTSIIGGLILLVVFEQDRNVSFHLSKTQYILTTHNGNHALDLYGSAKLYLSKPFDENQITLGLSMSTTTKVGPLGSEPVRVFDVIREYVFKTDSENNHHEIEVDGRRFLVRLRDIESIKTEQDNNALKYEFCIMEE